MIFRLALRLRTIGISAKRVFVTPLPLWVERLLCFRFTWHQPAAGRMRLRKVTYESAFNIVGSSRLAVRQPPVLCSELRAQTRSAYAGRGGPAKTHTLYLCSLHVLENTWLCPP